MSEIPLFVGPAYIAHPFRSAAVDEDGEPAELTRHQHSTEHSRNRCEARALADAARAAGVATVSPLQESAGASTMPETQWLIHGLIVLSVCKCLVLPSYWRESKGCRLERRHARELGLPAFEFVRDERGIFMPHSDFFAWRNAQRRFA